MKTPIQKLIDLWDQEMGSYIPNMPIFQAFIDDAKAMLEEEREVIEDAYRSGCSECGIGEPPEYTAEQYYDDHFNKEKK